MILTLDFASDIPIYVQIRNQIVQAIADGRLADGERLPTVRTLALEAGINTMTVNKAYRMLKYEGYIVTDRRNGATVCFGSSGSDEEMRRIKEKLRLIIAEAKTKGMTEEELAELCRRLYSGDTDTIKKHSDTKKGR